MKSKMNRMSSESHQTRLNGRVAIEMDKVNSKMDPMGRAIADYHKTKKASKLRVFSPMFEEDEIPLTTLFRSYDSMPKIERKALDLAKERILDVGAGAGCHSLVLQEKGAEQPITIWQTKTKYEHRTSTRIHFVTLWRNRRPAIWR